MPWHMEEDEIDALAANFLSAFGDVLAQSTNYGEAPASPMDLPFDMADGSLDSATKCPTLDGEDDHGHDFRALCQLSSSGLGFKAGPGGLPEAGSLEDAEQEFLRLTR
ncbi:Hypothetical Protein FCC1311_060672 [Hondaea fermentalgiana]|uniref:Uncharacterized protein n=1 Tax=Hondaea fermentalgiana TaxID=2315210 RepID=A0A2R5GG35_9STRA|nr:Hypothetical Protein FCC1311_060672 [Hondaea fermentalgiana]|eukprot:GBG29847.1 Hypothetical Protein FCC1311_060672 [Hondaea fermentalgiana]